MLFGSTMNHIQDTGLDDCLHMILSFSRKRMSGDGTWEGGAAMQEARERARAPFTMFPGREPNHRIGRSPSPSLLAHLTQIGLISNERQQDNRPLVEP